jgi:hypothetical protein
MPRDEDLPAYLTFRDLAAHLTRTRFRVSHRSLERWPLRVKLVNGRRHAETSQALAHADRMLAEAPTVATGRSGLRTRAPRIVRTG